MRLRPGALDGLPAAALPAAFEVGNLAWREMDCRTGAVWFHRRKTDMLVLDPESGKIIGGNEAATPFYGWSIPELKRMRIQQVHALSPEEVAGAMARAAAAQNARFGQWEVSLAEAQEEQESRNDGCPFCDRTGVSEERDASLATATT